MLLLMPLSSLYYNIYVKAMSNIILVFFGPSNSHGFVVRLKVLLLISRSIGLLHILMINTNKIFLYICFSPINFHYVQNQKPLSSKNISAYMSPFPKYLPDRNRSFENINHSSKLEPHVNLKANFPQYPFAVQHYFSIINMKFNYFTRTKNFSKRSGSKLVYIIYEKYNLVRSLGIYLISRILRNISENL